MLLYVGNAVENPEKMFHAEFSEELDTYEYKFSTVELKTDYIYTGEQVLLKGRINTVFKTNCALCLADIEYPIDIQIDETFVRQDESDEFYCFSGEYISLDKMVVDSILLNLPAKITCRPDCKGLCPVCGTNLNISSCACCIRQEQAENPFNKLKGLFEENEEV